MMSLLSLSSVSVQLSDKKILDEISCTIPMNKITVILGPSGGGKTTLLKAIVRLVPHQGEIYFQDKLIDNLRVDLYRKKVAYVSQVPHMFPGTVEDNIKWANPCAAINLLLEQVGLDSSFISKNCNSLSHGEKQRVQLARSLAILPKILLLDEPSSALDAISREGLELLVKSIVSENYISVVMVTHDISQAKAIADYIILINEGKVVLEGGAKEVLQGVKEMSEADTLRCLLKEGNGNV